MQHEIIIRVIVENKSESVKRKEVKSETVKKAVKKSKYNPAITRAVYDAVGLLEIGGYVDITEEAKRIKLTAK